MRSCHALRRHDNNKFLKQIKSSWQLRLHCSAVVQFEVFQKTIEETPITHSAIHATADGGHPSLLLVQRGKNKCDGADRGLNTAGG
jgi:hypothetical protein